MEEIKVDAEKAPLPAINDGGTTLEVVEIVNVSGHPQELNRSFGFWSICAIGICADNAWAAGGGTLVSCVWLREGERKLENILVEIVIDMLDEMIVSCICVVYQHSEHACMFLCGTALCGIYEIFYGTDEANKSYRSSLSTTVEPQASCMNCIYIRDDSMLGMLLIPTQHRRLPLLFPHWRCTRRTCLCYPIFFFW